MGKRGPKRKPTKVLKLRKSRHAKERSDIEIDLYLPKCPKDLTDRKARAYWRKIVPQLHKMGVLAEIDIESLVDLCEVYAERIRLRKYAQAPMIKHEKKQKDGTVKVTWEHNQWAAAYWRAVDRFKKMKADFFMSPADRAGMGGIQKKLEQDEKSRFFNKNA